jgi:hypothetical protein
MLATDNTVSGWSQVIRDLQAKQATNNSQIEELRATKKSLALEATMGNVEAKKRLDKLNAELNKHAMDADDFVIAVAAATAERNKAVQAEKDTIELQRQAELSKLATSATLAASKFTEAVRNAVSAGREAKATLLEMTRLAKPDEQANIRRLMDTSPYERTGEYLGLRDFIEWRSYTGPKEHLGPLETEFESLLSRWRKE